MKQKIVLTPEELAKLAVYKLVDEGKLPDNTIINVDWNIDNWNFQNSTIELSEVNSQWR